MLKSLTQFTHDLRTYVWGVSTNHLNWRETKFGFTGGIYMKTDNSPVGFKIQMWLRFPKVHILNAYEMECDFMEQREGRHA